MKKFYFILFIFFLNFTVSKSNEPFVVLEYQGNSSHNGSSKINKNNKFIKDQNYSTSHLVKEGESLSGILDKYYGNSGLNMRIVELSLVEINKHAFVRNNPNNMFSGKKLSKPSVKQNMNLVKRKPIKDSSAGNNKRNHIYFYGN